MSLFEKKKESKEHVCECGCGCGCTAPEAESSVSQHCCDEKVIGICSVKVLGAGCKSCHALYENTQKAVAEMGLPIEVEYITDMQKVMQYGVMSMPALVVNEKVVGTGKVYKPDEIVGLLKKFAN